MDVDWSSIARFLGEEEDLPSGATMMSVSPKVGRRVLERLLGDEALHDAVETAAGHGPGAGAAESLLIAIRSPRAADYCYLRFDAETDLDQRRDYARVLRSCAAENGTSWARELLEDRDAMVQILGANMLESLIGCGLVDWDEVESVLQVGESQENADVRQYTSFARIAFERVREE